MSKFKIIVSMPFGSRLYGCETENSDTDIKSIALPNKRDIILNNIGSHVYSFKTGNSDSKNSKDDIDLEIMHIYKFIKDALNGQTYAFDMLHAPSNILYRTSPVWEDITTNRKKFYSKNISAMYGYCKNQVAKYGMKSSRLNDAQEFIKFLNSYRMFSVNKLKLKDVWDSLPDLENSKKYIEGLPRQRIYEICGKKFQEAASLDYIFDIMRSFELQYGERAREAANNQNIDYKCWHHCARVGLQIVELFKDNTITMPRPERKLLLDIKQGKWSYNKFSIFVDELFEEINDLKEKSSLPDNPDHEFWNNWLYDTIENYINNK